jgi:uncharacterized RDD family membrane protein YckC
MLDDKRNRFLPATLNSRAWAFNIDCLLASLICIPFVRNHLPDLQSLISDNRILANSGDLGKLTGIIMEPFGKVMLISGIVTFAYFAISEILWHGTTIGKRLLKIKTVRTNDPFSGPSALQTLLRSIMKAAATFYCMDITNITICAISITNFFLGMISRTSSFGYDLLSRTMVVKYDYYECCPIEKSYSREN